MARPKGTKNNMRSPEEKEAIVLEYLNATHPSTRKTAEKYGISDKNFRVWVKKYRDKGIDGLKSQTGKCGNRPGNGLKGLQLKKNKTKEEELELENLKLKIEVARLKKGYLVKGVGSKKEYVTIKDLNMKS
ncbi:MAG: helix-turn-helix domain containing protein [bacterium]|nr:helix-turn-helix domain containing protein [bacterium]